MTEIAKPATRAGFDETRADWTGTTKCSKIQYQQYFQLQMVVRVTEISP